MSIIEAIILGLVQGLTEFLPVSSSGHLTIGQHLLGVDFVSGEQSLTFGIVVHAATVMATITVFFTEIKKLAIGTFKFKNNPETQYVLKIILSMVPVMIVGLFFKDFVESLFGNSVTFVGSMLIVTAAVLAFSHFFKPKKSHQLTYKDAFIIGVAQAMAVVPGISRSGSTIATGLLLGVDKSQLAKFSFLMVLVPILGQAFLELIGGEFSPEKSGISTGALIAGFIAAYAAGLMACKIMIKLVQQGKLYYFAIYCAIMGTLIIVTAL